MIINGPDGAPRVPGGALVAKHTVVSAVQQAVSVGVGLFLLPVMLRQLGTERYGLLLTVQILSISGIWSQADLGLYSSVTRYLATYFARHDANGFRRLLSTSFVLFALIGLATGLIVWGITEAVFFAIFDIPETTAGEVRLSLYVYATTFVLQFVRFPLKAFFAGIQQLVPLRIWEILERLMQAAAFVTILWGRPSILGLVIAEQGIAVALFLVYFVFARLRHGELFAPRLHQVSLGAVREILSFSVHVSASYISSFVLYQKLPEAVIAFALGPVMLAHYAIVTKIPRALKAMGAAVNGAVFPAAAAYDALAMRERVGTLVLRSLRYVYAVVTPVVVFILVFAPQILTIWVGPEYRFLGDLQRGMVVWQFVLFLILLMTAVFTRTAQYAAFLPLTLMANAVFIGIMVGGISSLGLWAVPAGLLVSGAMTAIALVRIHRTSNGIEYREFFEHAIKMPIIYTGLATFALCTLAQAYLDPTNALQLLVVGGTVYVSILAIVYRFGLITGERQEVFRLIRRVVRA